MENQMNKSYSFTKADSVMWDTIKTMINDDAAILQFLSEKSKQSGLIIITGVNAVAPIHFGGKAVWEFTYMASKPRAGYLKCLGDYYKIYPNGKIMQKIGKSFYLCGGG